MNCKTVAQGLHNMGNLAYRQGDYEKAEDLYKIAIGIKEKILGRLHPGEAFRNTIDGLA